MWSIPRRRALCRRAALGAVAVALAGCGFEPLYRSGGGGGEAALATVRVAVIEDRIGQKLRNMLTERFSPRGLAAETQYILTIKLTEAKSGLAIKKDETATRANLTIRADFKLDAVRNPSLGVFSGQAFSTNSYNILESDFATLGAEKDARNRALRSLAEEIRIRVAAALRNPKTFSGPVAPKPG